MKKTLIVLCGSALLLVGLFSITPTAQPQSPRMAEIKAFAAKENDCVAGRELKTHTLSCASSETVSKIADNKLLLHSLFC